MAPSATTTTTTTTAATIPDSTTSSKQRKNQSFDFTTFSNVINGKLVDTQKHRNGINPATMDALPEVPVAGQSDLDTAVDSARLAFKKWSKVPFAERAAAVNAFASALEAEKVGFATLLTTEQGKPTFQSVIEIDTAVAWLRGHSELEIPEEILEDSPERKITSRYTPLGVVGAIVPWNFPILLATIKVGPAVLTGNTIIIKPSPFTPYCALKVAELAMQFFPPGVIQCLSGEDNLGPMLTAHPGIDKISFTGSTATGKLVAASAAKTLKRVTLELGGNDAAIVCADVDIPSVAAQVATYAFLNSGQICMNVKRVYIHETIYPEFRDALVAHVQTLNTGAGSDPTTFCGPIQNKMQYEIVKGFFADIEKEKWKVAVGGNVENSTGYFINPTIIDNPPQTSRIVVEEPFGPILPIVSYRTYEEAIELANDTTSGLGASVWSADIELAEKLARQIESGTVWINTHFDLASNTPFGGHKESGQGVEMGITGMKGMCNHQTVTIKKSKL